MSDKFNPDKLSVTNSDYAASYEDLPKSAVILSAVEMGALMQLIHNHTHHEDSPAWATLYQRLSTEVLDEDGDVHEHLDLSCWGPMAPKGKLAQFEFDLSTILVSSIKDYTL